MKASRTVTALRLIALGLAAVVPVVDVFSPEDVLTIGEGIILLILIAFVVMDEQGPR